MSLISEVLSSLGRKSSEVEKVTEIKEVLRKSEEVKVEILEFVENYYTNLSVVLQETAHLHQKVTGTLEELSDIYGEIKKILPEVESSAVEIEELASQWHETYYGLQASDSLLKIHNLLEEVYNAEHNCKYHLAATKLDDVKSFLKEMDNKEIEKHLNIVSILREELIIRRTQLLYTVLEIWNTFLRWEEEKASDNILFILHIKKMSTRDSENVSDQVKDIFMALYALGELHTRLKSFSKLLMQNLVRPIFLYDAELSTKDFAETYALEVTLILHKKPSLFSVLKSLKDMKEDFTQALIKDCIAEAVPSCSSDSDIKEKIKEVLNDFHQFLLILGFYDDSDKSILEYAANIDVVFSNKACASLLDKARGLMLQPLHLSVTVLPDKHDESISIVDDSSEILKKSTDNLERLLSAKTFHLPRCQISMSTCKLVDLLYDVLDEACTSNPQYAGRLFYTVRNILSLYCHIVPPAHSENLITIPQQAALLHNNSMYLAHHALLFGHQYKSRLSPLLAGTSITATDLAVLLRKTGSSVFLNAVQSHRNSIVALVKESINLSSLETSSGILNQAEQGIKQCMHQLKLLQKVWQSVLPLTVYSRTLGMLVSSVVEEILTRILAMEDISSNSALSLIGILDMFKDKIPFLFEVEETPSTSSSDVLRYVKKWNKLCELILFLGAGLKEILDRWADGKGPFAHEFTPEEAKHLVRALFQNTEQRAQALSKIK